MHGFTQSDMALRTTGVNPWVKALQLRTGRQLSLTHYQKNAASKVVRKHRGDVHDQLRDMFAAPHLEEAQRRTACRGVTSSFRKNGNAQDKRHRSGHLGGGWRR